MPQEQINSYFSGGPEAVRIKGESRTKGSLAISGLSFFNFFFIEIRPFSVALVGLGLAMYARLASNARRYDCVCPTQISIS